MDGTLLLAGATGLVTAFGVLESWSHRRNMRRIPIRIHVNGTRGKSGVTRLIASGLRAGGIRTCAKTTGTLPRMILPDGSEYPVFRPSRANVIEQVRILKTAAAYDAEAIVIECMAVQPVLQSLCELQLVRATHGVITNARADHLDAMGPTAADVALALAGTTPVDGTLFTTERKHLGTFRNTAKDRNSSLVALDENDVNSVSVAELSRFPYVEYRENVALALRVCSSLGIDRQTALEGMWASTPDPGVMTIRRAVDLSGDEMVFVNAFAANDPESTEQNWNLAIDRFPEMTKKIAIFNCRSDRPDRSIQLAEACVHWHQADHNLLIGSGTKLFASRATACGMNRSRMTLVEGTHVEQIVRRIADMVDRPSLVMGMGNIGEPGLGIVRYFDEHSVSSTVDSVQSTVYREAA